MCQQSASDSPVSLLVPPTSIAVIHSTLSIMTFNTQEQSVMTDSVVMTIVNEEKPAAKRKITTCCGISLDNLTRIAIHLILPLTLGIFTVLIAFYQQQVINQQRLEDRELARNQREHDLNISTIQREQDLNISTMQREHDKMIAREQREEDELRRYQDLNISASRRDLDLYIADSKRLADDLNTEKQRNMSQEQRRHELEIEEQRYEKQLAIENERYEQERSKYQAQLSLSYMNEIGNLLERHNGVLNSNPTTAALARAKTFNVIGQLGSNRSKHLIEFLYDAKQLTAKNNPLDISGAQLNGLDFSGSSGLRTRQSLSLVGVYMNQAMFEGLEIFGWDFTSASLNGAIFRNCNITNTTFDRASLIEADFSFSYLDMNTFYRADLTMSKFHAAVARSSSFEHATLVSTNFDSVKSHAKTIGRHLRFNYSNLFSATFRDAVLTKVYFHLCNMTSADLSRATIAETVFFGTILAFASITNNKRPLKLSNFPYANLSHANLSGSTCVDRKCDTDMALSLHNVHLPDGKLGKPRATIIEGGNASFCENYDKISEAKLLLDEWEKQPVNGFIIRRERAVHNRCVYSMAKNETGKLYQKVRLNGPYKPSFIGLISTRQAVAIFRAIVSEGVEILIEEKGVPQQIIRNHTLSRNLAEDNSPFITSIPIILHPDTKELIFTINFFKLGSIRWLQWIDIEINPLFIH